MKDKLGREIFCPLGVLGRCSVIPTTEKSKEIARFHRWYPMTAVIASAVVMALFGRLFGVGVGALAIGMLFAKYCRWQSSMTVCESEAVPTFPDLHRANERGAGKVRLWLLLASCIAVLAMLV